LGRAWPPLRTLFLFFPTTLLFPKCFSRSPTLSRSPSALRPPVPLSSLVMGYYRRSMERRPKIRPFEYGRNPLPPSCFLRHVLLNPQTPYSSPPFPPCWFIRKIVTLISLKRSARPPFILRQRFPFPPKTFRPAAPQLIPIYLAPRTEFLPPPRPGHWSRRSSPPSKLSFPSQLLLFPLLIGLFSFLVKMAGLYLPTPLFGFLVSSRLRNSNFQPPI